MMGQSATPVIETSSSRLEKGVPTLSAWERRG
jgi:hypothetical protein